MIKLITNIINNIIYTNNKVVIDDLSCYTFNYDDNTEYIILYLHGGAFLIRDISYFTLLNKICKQNKKISSLYLKYTLNNPKENLREVEKIMNFLKNKNKKVILMGYSAGGYICLRYYINAVKCNMPLPFKMILISPWINPQKEINNSNDLIPSFLYNIVSSNTDTQNISDLDLNINFCKIFLIYGEYDILVDQIEEIKEKIKIYKQFVCIGYGHTFLYLAQSYLIKNIIDKIIHFIIFD